MPCIFTNYYVMFSVVSFIQKWFVIKSTTVRIYVEIKCQLDATEFFIADLVACSTCFGHHYAHHQELKSIMQDAALQHPANWTHNLSSTPDQQLENHSTKYHRQQSLYNTLEPLMMGIVVPETC